jgi:hypothetical protein
MEATMKLLSLLTGATVALLSLAGCSAAQPSESAPAPVAPQAAAPAEQDQGWAVLIEADREVNTLEAQRDATSDPFVQDAITHQIGAIVARSDALVDEMTVGDGRSHDARIRRLSAALQHDMGVGVATEMQGGGPSGR